MNVKNIVLTILLILSVAIFWIVYEPPPKPNPKAEMFSMELEAPKEVEAGIPFIVNGFLHNDSKYDWMITHSADMFKYQVVDEHGKLVPRGTTEVFWMNNIGMGHLLKRKTRYTNDGGTHVSRKLNELKFNEPGKYVITSYATFNIREEINGNVQHFGFKLESDPVTVIVK